MPSFFDLDHFVQVGWSTTRPIWPGDPYSEISAQCFVLILDLPDAPTVCVCVFIGVCVCVCVWCVCVSVVCVCVCACGCGVGGCVWVCVGVCVCVGVGVGVCVCVCVYVCVGGVYVCVCTMQYPQTSPTAPTNITLPLHPHSPTELKTVLKSLKYQFSEKPCFRKFIFRFHGYSTHLGIFLKMTLKGLKLAPINWQRDSKLLHRLCLLTWLPSNSLSMFLLPSNQLSRKL